MAKDSFLTHQLSRRGVLAGAAGIGAVALLPGNVRAAKAISGPSTSRTQLTTAAIAANPAEIARTYQSLSASDLNPSGFYLPPATELTVTIDAATATQSALVVGAPDAEIDVAKRKPRVYPLKVGKVTITDPHGGPVYWKVIGTSGYLKATLGTAAQPMPFYIAGNTTEGEFQNQLDRRTTPYVEFVSAHALVTVQREAALRFRGENHAQLMATFEEVINIEDTTAGLDGTSATDSRLDHRFHLITRGEGIVGIGAYATQGHTLYPAPIQDRLLTVEALRLRGWGVYHELGHQHQQTVYKPSSLTEVTVNLYSLAVNAAFAVKYGQAPRLHVPETGGDSVWTSAPPKIGTEGVDFSTTFTGMEKLVLFEQLRLGIAAIHAKLTAEGAKDKIKPDLPKDIHAAVHKAVRADKPDPGKPSDEVYRLSMLVYFYSKAANRDLREFFAKWGLQPRADIDAKITALKLAKPELDLTTIRDDAGEIAAAKVLKSAQLRQANGIK